jgi:hypothetical protein
MAGCANARELKTDDEGIMKRRKRRDNIPM